MWRALAACLLPGAHALAMSHDSTYHLLGVAMHRAGLLPRHMIPWLYATGRCQAQRVTVPEQVDGKRVQVTPSDLEGLAPRLAPGVEPAYLGRLSLEAGCSVAENLRKHGTGALRVDAVRQPRGVGDVDGWAAKRSGEAGYRGGMSSDVSYSSPEGGRYPKNVVHDGSPEVVAVFDRQGTRVSRPRKEGNVDNALPSYRTDTYPGGPRKEIVGSSGSGARYFPSIESDGDAFAYVPKPKGAARDESGGHPTPKPLALMRWFVRMVTCFPGQVVIDPFLGSGTTMRAALDEGMSCVGIELDEVTAGGQTVCLGYCATVVRRCPEVHEHIIGRALAELGLVFWTYGVPASRGEAFAVSARDGSQGYLCIVREPAGEATCRDPLGRAMGLTLEGDRVQLNRAWLEVELAPGAPPDLADKLAELAGWPEVQALLCRRGDLVDPSQ